MALSEEAERVLTDGDHESELQASRREFRELKERCGPEEMVCGTIKANGRPVYFLAPRDLPEPALEERAFAARNGRGRFPGEVTLAEMAAKYQ